MLDGVTCCIVVYGCAKNQVDAEEMACRLREAGALLAADPSQADVVIVHTCGFIRDAKEESIQGILEMCQLAQDRASEGKNIKVIVTGCLSQRYPRALFDEIPEVAGIFGTNAPRDIVQMVERVIAGERVLQESQPGRGAPGRDNLRAVPPGQTWAYVRVSEGCRHRCTYCAIPLVRGPLSSRPPEDIVNEVKMLVSQGVQEINLIAQDLSDYGVDLTGKRELARLVRELSGVQGVHWVRLLYVRPDGITPELAEAMAHPKVAPYIDMPIEHGSPRILRLMGRPGPDTIMGAVELLREKVPGLFIRTTVIAGFPGETEKDIEDTMDLLSDIGVHRVAVFPYSREEGTPAYNLPGQLPARVRKQRAEMLRRFGLELARRSSEALVGKEIPILLMSPSARKGYWIGRGPHQAPEVDGKVYVKTQSPQDLFITASVTRSAVLDLFAVPTS